MRMFVTTAAMMAALTVSAFAEGELLGTQAPGEADGSFQASVQQPIGSSIGQSAMAQGSLPSKATKVSSKGTKAPKAKHLTKGAASHASAIRPVKASDQLYNDTGYSPDSLKSPTGMDGGNRK
jgi:hypothetical protein